MTTVPRVLPTGLLLALGLAPRLARADAVAFVHETSVYVDAKGSSLKAPEGVACAPNGYVVVADTGNHRLLTFTFKEGRVSGGDELKLKELVSPVRLQIDGKGNVLALDAKTRRIVRLTATGGYGGPVETKGLEGDAPVVGAFKLDANDNLYLLDVVGRRVLVLDPTDAVSWQVAFPKDAGTVTDIAVDTGGTLYAIDAVGARLWSADKGTKAFRPLGPSLKDRVAFPTYVAANGGRLFLVDTNGQGIALLGADGSFQGRQLAFGWGDGLVNYPGQLCFAPGGIAFLADRNNNRVQAFTTGAK